MQLRRDRLSPRHRDRGGNAAHLRNVKRRRLATIDPNVEIGRLSRNPARGRPALYYRDDVRRALQGLNSGGENGPLMLRHREPQACFIFCSAFWHILNLTMNILLWVLQSVAALMYGASGVMKVFMFDKIKDEVPSFGALPRPGWVALGILELVCVVGLIAPSVLNWRPSLTVVAAALLATESLVFVWVHTKYNETGSIIMSVVLGLVMALIAYGRLVLRPIA
ncbi:MAG: DoxX family protein [Acidobacteria bacterium]|nr:DoxX family protein [Acidobacteriota bacterium]